MKVDQPVTIVKKNNVYIMSDKLALFESTGQNLNDVFEDFYKKRDLYIKNLESEGYTEEQIFNKIGIVKNGFENILISILDLLKHYKFLLSFIVVIVSISLAVSSASWSIVKNKNRLMQKLDENISNQDQEKLEERLKRMDKYLNFSKPYIKKYKKFISEIDE